MISVWRKPRLLFYKTTTETLVIVMGTSEWCGDAYQSVFFSLHWSTVRDSRYNVSTNFSTSLRHHTALWRTSGRQHSRAADLRAAVLGLAVTAVNITYIYHETLPFQLATFNCLPAQNSHLGLVTGRPFSSVKWCIGVTAWSAARNSPAVVESRV